MWLIIWMNRFKMFLQLSFLRISMITDRDLFQLFLYELVQYDLPNWLFQKNHSHNFIMFFDILSSWKWLACLSKMSILQKLKSQTGQLCDLLFEWADSRYIYNSFFWEIAWSLIEIFFHFFFIWSGCSMLFQIDLFRKIIITTLDCLVTSCPHEAHF